MDWVHTICRR